MPGGQHCCQWQAPGQQAPELARQSPSRLQEWDGTTGEDVALAAALAAAADEEMIDAATPAAFAATTDVIASAPVATASAATAAFTATAAATAFTTPHAPWRHTTASTTVASGVQDPAGAMAPDVPMGAGAIIVADASGERQNSGKQG
jgi:hypothetical protein